MRASPSVVLLVFVLGLSGCAPARTPVQRLGAYELLQPRLRHGRSGTTLQLARPAHVQILQISSEGALRVYPHAPHHGSYFEAGSHSIDIVHWRNASSPGPGACAPHEGYDSAWPDERDRRPSTRTTRPSTRRGSATLCTGSSGRRSPTRDVLVLASAEPLQTEQVSNMLASLPAAANAEVLAARIGEAAGVQVWAAYVAQISVR